MLVVPIKHALNEMFCVKGNQCASLL